MLQPGEEGLQAEREHLVGGRFVPSAFVDPASRGEAATRAAGVEVHRAQQRVDLEAGLDRLVLPDPLRRTLDLEHPELKPGSTRFSSLNVSSPFSCSHNTPDTGSNAIPKLFRRP